MDKLPTKVSNLKKNDKVISTDQSCAYLISGRVIDKDIINSAIYFAIEFEKKIIENNFEAEKKHSIKKGHGAYVKITNLRKIINDNFDLKKFGETWKNKIITKTGYGYEKKLIDKNKLEKSIIKKTKKIDDLTKSKVKLKNKNNKILKKKKEDIIENKNIKEDEYNKNKKVKIIENEDSMNYDTKENIFLNKESNNIISEQKICIEKLKSSNMDLQCKIKELNNTLKLQKNTEELTKINETLNNKLDNNKIINNEKNKENQDNKIKLEWKNIKEELHKTKIENKNLNEEIINIRKIKNKITSKNDNIRVRNGSKQDDKSKELQLDINTWNSEINDLKIKIEEYELDKNIHELKLELTTITSIIPTNYEELLEEFKIIKSLYDYQSENYKIQINNYQNKINNLVNEFKLLENKDKQNINTDEYENIFKLKDTEIEDLNLKIIELNKKLNGTKEDFKNLEIKDKLIENLKNINKEKIEINTYLESINKMYDDINNDLFQQTELLTSENNNLKNIIKEKEEINNRNTEKLKELEIHIEILKSNVYNNFNGNNQNFNKLMSLDTSFDKNLLVIKKNAYYKGFYLNKINKDVLINYINYIPDKYKSLNYFEKFINLKEIEIINKNIIEIFISNHFNKNKKDNVTLINYLFEIDKYLYLFVNKLLNMKDSETFLTFYNNSCIQELLNLKEYFKNLLNNLNNNENLNYDILKNIIDIIKEKGVYFFNELEIKNSEILKNINNSYLNYYKVIKNSKEFSKHKSPELYYNKLEEFKDLIKNLNDYQISDKLLDISIKIKNINSINDYILIDNLIEVLKDLYKVDYSNTEFIWNKNIYKLKSDLENTDNVLNDKNEIICKNKELEKKIIELSCVIENFNRQNEEIRNKFWDYEIKIKNYGNFDYNLELIKNNNTYLQKEIDNYKGRIRDLIIKIPAKKNIIIEKFKKIVNKIIIINRFKIKKEVPNNNPTKYNFRDKKKLKIFENALQKMKFCFINNSITKIINKNKTYWNDMPNFSIISNNNNIYNKEILDILNDIKEKKGKLINNLINVKAVNLNNIDYSKDFYESKNKFSIKFLKNNNLFDNKNYKFKNVVNIKSNLTLIGNFKFNKDLIDNKIGLNDNIII